MNKLTENNKILKETSRLSDMDKPLSSFYNRAVMFATCFVHANTIESIMATEYISDLEETNCDDDDEVEYVLKITPLLSFASGPALGVQSDKNNNLFELQKPANLEKIAQSDGNCKQTNVINGDANEAVKKHDAKFNKGKVKNVKLDGCSESNAIRETAVLPEKSPRSRRRHNMVLIRSLSTSATAPKSEEIPKRRLSDPPVPCQKTLAKSAFDRQASLKKLRPYLKRKAASHLLGKVASSSGSAKHSHDVGHLKEPKGSNRGSNKARLAKRLYPYFSKAHEYIERRGSDPSGSTSVDDTSGNDYETVINDFSSQIQDLAFNLENLSAGGMVRHELQENLSAQKPEYGAKDENSSETFFKEADIHLQEMLEEVLRSHLLALDDYSTTSCDRASRSICKIITRLLGGAVKRTDDGQRKLACLVFIGAVRDNGIEMATQAQWCPEEDTFAAASYRNESVYGMAVVIATPT